jgi:hypothetical protein
MLEDDPSSGVAFEQLVLDILTEDCPRANRASFAEDLLERTDLRIRYPDLQRRHGARIQVSSSCDPVRHDQKLAAIRFHEEFVIVSPLELARWIERRSESGDLDLNWAVLRESLGARFFTVEELGKSLRGHFQAALGQKSNAPLGPVSSVHPHIKQITRAYVKDAAFQATDTLRYREGTWGVFRGTLGRLRPPR